MRQIVVTKTGGPNVLKVQAKRTPSPGDEELAIRVKASGVNFADILARKGMYPDGPKPPCVVGYEVSGVVEVVGRALPENWMGKPVVALTRFGGYSDWVVVPANQVFVKPSKLSFEEAVVLPVNYLTAYQLLVVMGGLQKGESVLVHNAGGGVGLAAVDIARHRGAVAYGTASGKKHAFLKDRGVRYCMDYSQDGKEDWLAQLLRITKMKGVELVVDPLGASHWKKSCRALRSTGRLGMFGVSSASVSRRGGKWRLLTSLIRMPWFHPLWLLGSNKGVFGVNMGRLWHEVDKVQSWMNVVLEGVEAGWVRPHVDRVFSFNEAAQAHEYIESRRNIGKVVLVPDTRVSHD